MRLPLLSGLAALGTRDNGDLQPRANVGEVGPQSESLKFVLSHTPIVMARIDPIISPGQVGTHSHNVFGASNFRSYLNTPEEQARSTCATPSPQADKSNYWSPTLYWKYDDGTLEPLHSSARTYYFGNGNSNDKTYTTPFPRGMRIISGTAMSRHDSDIRKAFIHMDCLQPSGGSPIDTSPYLPNGTNVPGGCIGIRTGVYFPSCGLADQSLDSDNHFSHMTWPIETGGGQGWFKAQGQRCPPTHPIKYPMIFMETNHYMNPRMIASGWRKENVMLANGDTLGTSFHSDFVSGWDEDVLREAANTCTVGDQIQKCPALAKSVVTQPSPGNICLHEGMQPDENIGLFSPIKQLPGANCRWGAEMGPSKPNCPSTPAPGWTYSNLLWVNRGSSNSLLIPAQVPVNQDMSENALSSQYASKAAGSVPAFRPCSEDGNERAEILQNRVNIRCGSNQDIIDNLAMGTAKNKIDSVPVMQDRTPFTSRVRANPVGTEAWRVFPAANIPNDSCWTKTANIADTNCLSSADKIRGTA